MKNIIKLIFPIFIFAAIASCNDRFEGDEIQNIDALKIDSVKVANFTMDVYSTQTIKTYSKFTTNCEGFYGYEYLHTDQFDRKVVSYKFKTDANCGEEVTRSSQINFQPQQVGTYYFRFFAGKDSAGEDTWIEKIIEVK